MEQENHYFAVSQDKLQQRASWQNNWPNPLSSWQTTAPEMPIWHYTTAALNHGDNSMPYYPSETPLSPSYTNNSSNLNSPSTSIFPPDPRFISQPLTPRYEKSNRLIPQPQPQPQVARDESMDEGEDEDSDTIAWEPKVSTQRPMRPVHRRSQSANELSVKKAKRAHTVVEKNYRERLNDKINDLALYLFETASDSRTKPSKSLVMTRAKERLKQLESRNKNLESEVVQLRQRIAILDHVVASNAASNGNGNGNRDTGVKRGSSEDGDGDGEDDEAAGGGGGGGS